MEIHLIFTKNNKLKFSILNNQYRHGDFKICFSLVYSIQEIDCLLYTSPSPRDKRQSRMPSSA